MATTCSITARSSPPGRSPRLKDRIASGKSSLKHDERFGYLLAVLREFDIPLSSQMLVFTKTSLQRPNISPKSPHVIFFNDDVYVAWAPDAADHSDLEGNKIGFTRLLVALSRASR